METPNKNLTIKVQNNEYGINFPNNGQLIDIEAMKHKLSQGTMDMMLLGQTTTSNDAWITVSMIASFTILIPNLIKSLRVKSLLELTPMQSKELRDVFLNSYLPWYQAWEDVINAPVEEEEEPKFDEEKDIEPLP
jgi:hypothetical protein